MTGLESAVGSALAEEFQRQVEGALRAERQPDVGGSPEALAVPFSGNPCLQAGGGLPGVFFQDNVDDATNCVGAVLGHSALAKHLDPFDGG